jgi:hypothetical protein
MQLNLDEKAGRVVHIWPVRLPLLYLFIYQGFNSIKLLSIYPEESWSGELAFPARQNHYISIV